jgi:hypothetical protein
MMEFFTVGGSGREVGSSHSNYAPPVGSSDGSAAIDMYNEPSTDDGNDWKDF